METHYSKKDFEKFLESIGGLENGYFTDRPPIVSGFGIGEGWLPLVKKLIEDLIAIGWDKQICQVKEKFGGLRFYTNALPEGGHELVRAAENASYTICETCGQPGEQRALHWVLTLCDKHYQEKIDARKADQ